MQKSYDSVKIHDVNDVDLFELLYVQGHEDKLLAEARARGNARGKIISKIIDRLEREEDSIKVLAEGIAELRRMETIYKARALKILGVEEQYILRFAELSPDDLSQI